MAIVRNIEDVLAENPDFSIGFTAETATTNDGRKIVVALDKPNIARYRLVVYCRDDGAPMYSEVVISEGPTLDDDGKRPLSSGSVVVPFYKKNGRISLGLIERERPAIRYPEADVQGKQVSLEFPRGFSLPGEEVKETAIRELDEEFGPASVTVYPIGRINPNTSNYTTPGIPVNAIEISHKAFFAGAREDKYEKIFGSRHVSRQELDVLVSTGEIFCGLTLGALSLFDSFVRREFPDSSYLRH